MNGESISPLRRRMIEDMTVRKFVEKTQKDYIRQPRHLYADRDNTFRSRLSVRQYGFHMVRPHT